MTCQDCGTALRPSHYNGSDEDAARHFAWCPTCHPGGCPSCAPDATVLLDPCCYGMPSGYECGEPGVYVLAGTKNMTACAKHREEAEALDAETQEGTDDE